MAGPLRVDRDIDRSRWLQRSLTDLGAVSAAVPDRFEAHARILHPAALWTPTGETDAHGQPRQAARPIPWREAEALLGGAASPDGPAHTAWLARFGEHASELPGGAWLQEPVAGDIPPELLAALAELLVDEHGDAEVVAAVWEGSGLDPDATGIFAWFDDSVPWWRRRAERRRMEREHRERHAASIDPEVAAAMRAGATLGLPRDGQGRGHVLLRGRLSALADPTWVERAGLGWRADWPQMGRTPNAIWPVGGPDATGDDPAPAWFVATDLDLDVTLVGGTGALIARILAAPALEAERIRPEDPLL